MTTVRSTDDSQIIDMRGKAKGSRAGNQPVGKAQRDYRMMAKAKLMKMRKNQPTAKRS